MEEKEAVQEGQSSVRCAGPPGGLLANSVELTWETNKDIVGINMMLQIWESVIELDFRLKSCDDKRLPKLKST